MRSACVAVSFVALLACGGPDVEVPAPFALPPPGAAGEKAIYGAFSTQGDAFSLGVSTTNNSFYVWRSGQVLPIGRVANATSSVLLEGGNAALVVSDFAFVSARGTEHAYVVSLQRGGATIWRRGLGVGSDTPPVVRVIGGLAFAPSPRGAFALDLATGRVVREFVGGGQRYTAVDLGGGLAAVAGDRLFVMRTDTGAAVCDAAPLALWTTPWPLPPGVVASDTKDVNRQLVSRVAADCTVTPVAQGAYPVPVDGGFALSVDRDAANVVPLPSIVDGNPARQQLVVFDASGVATRAIPLPAGTTLAAPTRDLSRAFLLIKGVGTSVLDVATGADVASKQQRGFFSHASDDRQFLFFSSGVNLTRLDVATGATVDSNVIKVVGIFAGTLVVQSPGEYQRLAFDTLKPVDTARIP